MFFVGLQNPTIISNRVKLFIDSWLELNLNLSTAITSVHGKSFFVPANLNLYFAYFSNIINIICFVWFIFFGNNPATLHS